MTKPESTAAALSLADRDALFRHQLASPSTGHYLYLDSAALEVAGVCKSAVTAKKTLQLLQQFGFVLPAPPHSSPGDHGDNSSHHQKHPNRSITYAFTIPARDVANLPAGLTVNTAFVDKNLRRHLNDLDSHAQRRVVHVLIFWEAECRRWEQLAEDEEDLVRAIKRASSSSLPSLSSSEDYRVALLERVRRRKWMLPSQRSRSEEAAAGIADTARAARAAGGAGAATTMAATTAPVYEDDPPPPYPGLP